MPNKPIKPPGSMIKILDRKCTWVSADHSAFGWGGPLSRRPSAGKLILGKALWHEFVTLLAAVFNNQVAVELQA
jgi:hypothetical protein